MPPPNGEEAEEDHPPSRSESHLKSLMRDELLISVQKFATQVSFRPFSIFCTGPQQLIQAIPDESTIYCACMYDCHGMSLELLFIS